MYINFLFIFCSERASALGNSNSTLFCCPKKPLYHYTIPFYNTSSIPNFYFPILLIKIIYLHNKIIFSQSPSFILSFSFFLFNNHKFYRKHHHHMPTTAHHHCTTHTWHHHHQQQPIIYHQHKIYIYIYIFIYQTIKH